LSFGLENFFTCKTKVELEKNTINYGGLMRRFFNFACIFALILLFNSSAIGLDIFVWENDNSLRLIDDVLQDTSLSHEAITQSLDILEYDYDSDASLPEDLSEYDIVIVSTGFSCPS